ncbi:hypothetical protein [Streptomyces tubercidicus]|uniref:hypothetical protein n=1 Tax=Streptomyces tubercidicus TaxID=47759 RepID=UPI0037B9EA22
MVTSRSLDGAGGPAGEVWPKCEGGNPTSPGRPGAPAVAIGTATGLKGLVG